PSSLLSLFFFTDLPTSLYYLLSLHDALPIFAWCSSCPGCIARQAGHARLLKSCPRPRPGRRWRWPCPRCTGASIAIDVRDVAVGDRKSTRLNSSHVAISYAVFCLKKKKNNHK